MGSSTHQRKKPFAYKLPRRNTLETAVFCVFEIWRRRHTTGIGKINIPISVTMFIHHGDTNDQTRKVQASAQLGSVPVVRDRFAVKDGMYQRSKQHLSL